MHGRDRADAGRTEAKPRYINYSITQTYEYDSLHQLTGGHGTLDKQTISGENNLTRYYDQKFEYDNLGRMTKKESKNMEILPNDKESPIEDHKLNHTLNYNYDAQGERESQPCILHGYDRADAGRTEAKLRYNEWVYRATQIAGESDNGLFYQYDANGNTVASSAQEFENAQAIDGEQLTEIEIKDGTWMVDGTLTGGTAKTSNPLRESFVWDEDNKLKKSVNKNYTVDYLYGPGGERVYAQGERE